MKQKIFFLFLFIQFSATAQKQEVQKVIEDFFVGFHQKDTLKLKEVCSDKIVLQSISESKIKGNKLSNESRAEFYKAIFSIPAGMKFSEKIISYNIQIDGAMANVWAPYEFYINDKLSHSGVNTFTFI